MSARVSLNLSAGVGPYALAFLRASDGFLLDYSTGPPSFVATPVTPTIPIAAGGALSTNVCFLIYTPTAWVDGQYIAYAIDSTGRTVDQAGLEMHAGDDAPVFPSGAGVDPWSVTLPAGYGPNTAGADLALVAQAVVGSETTITVVADAANSVSTFTVSGITQVLPGILGMFVEWTAGTAGNLKSRQPVSAAVANAGNVKLTIAGAFGAIPQPSDAGQLF
jgi:hypothetical protein